MDRHQRCLHEMATVAVVTAVVAIVVTVVVVAVACGSEADAAV